MIHLATAFLVGPVDAAQPSNQPPTQEALAEQLRTLGLTVVDAADPNTLQEAIQTAPEGRVALVDRRLVAQSHVLRQVVADPRPIAAAGPGAVAVAQAAREQLLTAVTIAGADPDPDHIAAALASELPLKRIDPAPLVAKIASTPAEAAELRAQLDDKAEERVRLNQSVKAEDSLFTSYVVSPWTKYVARWCARGGIRPNQVTWASAIVALVAGVLAATGTRAGLTVGALLLLVSFFLDSIDGQLARYTYNFTKLGSWLDATFDKAKEFVFFAGLAYGAATQPGDEIWLLAASAVAFQLVRHMMHFAYSETSVDAGVVTTSAQARLAELHWTVGLRRLALLPQGERMLLIAVLTIAAGPRTMFLVLLGLGLLSALYGFTGRILRSLRKIRRGWSQHASWSLGAMVDVGPIGWLWHHALPGRSLPAPLVTLIALIVLTGALLFTPSAGAMWILVGVLWYVLLISFASRQPLNGWADWVLPPSYRAAECAVAIGSAAILAPQALPAAFAYVAAVSYHHYDTVYRLRGAETAPPRWLVAATGGHDGRMLILALLTLAGSAWLAGGLIVLAIYLAVLFVAESVVNTATWVRGEPTQRMATLVTGDGR